jgi:competence protein ComEA
MKKPLVSLLIALSLSFNAFAAVNINTASKAELETLNGIGANKADAIIKYRKENGHFKSVNDLTNIKGIGPKIVKQIGKDATVTGKTSSTEKQDVDMKTKKTNQRN